MILKYLTKNYRITLDGALNYTVFDVTSESEQQLIKVLNSLKKVFSIDVEEINDVLMVWVEGEITKINNKITDIKYKIYQKTGLELELSHNDLVNLINQEYYKND
jgi:hypothetical protein